MAKILGIAGSLRKGSLNAALLRAAAELAPQGCEIEIGSIHGIPLYDGDLEDAEGIPDAVLRLKERVVANDGLLLVTPEYNNSIPGVMKNAIDWLSRPGLEIPQVFGGRPVGLIGVSPGSRGTVFAQTAWLPVLRMLGTRPWFGKSLYVGGAMRMFDESGRLVDEKMRERLQGWVKGFAEFVETSS